VSPARSGATSTGDGPGIPLARLLATAYRQLIDGLHERLRELGWTDVRPAYGFVLLAARSRPTTNAEIATLMGTTKQAASKLLDAMDEAGYITRTADDHDGRVKIVTLAPRGVELLAAVEQIYAALEADWASVIGAAAVERVRRDLTQVLISTNDGELPPVRPSW
jgi:DNA-binding MarR family transcriptional regulator